MRTTSSSCWHLNKTGFVTSGFGHSLSDLQSTSREFFKCRPNDEMTNDSHFLQLQFTIDLSIIAIRCLLNGHISIFSSNCDYLRSRSQLFCLLDGRVVREGCHDQHDRHCVWQNPLQSLANWALNPQPSCLCAWAITFASLQSIPLPQR